MALVILGFLLAVLFAIPTYGISLLAFFALKFLIDHNGVAKLTAAAVNSYGSGNPVVLPHINNAAIRSFFQRYGTTEKKYERFESPFGFYIGYVKTLVQDEHVVLIGRQGGNLIVNSIETPVQFGDDFVSLVGKKQFIDEIVSGLQSR
ncbi:MULTISPECIES: hypothetical protein [Pseudomonas]|uniref:Uncharacterized protein n=1 Tax=Pseudomonas putida TaxID=303 RepID=A0AAW5HDP5_PSEPU|nr:MULTISPECIES: hypothetical protein [Pseudomonas]MCA4075343.1 hypothetical protein [Pseudomonas kurunegalensis]MCO1619264.1 hypothetical protein [Pseudomonas putida]